MSLPRRPLRSAAVACAPWIAAVVMAVGASRGAALGVALGSPPGPALMRASGR